MLGRLDITKWTSGALRQMLLVCVSIVLVGGEGYELFVVRTVSLRTEGETPIPINEFRDGVAVEHGFSMVGDGLRAVSVRFSTERPVSIHVLCELTEALEDKPGARAEIYHWTSSIDLSSGMTWTRFDFPPIGRSSDRYYKFQIRLLDVRLTGEAEPKKSGERPPIAIMASTDNPPRGGALWIDGVRQSGSLYIRAHGAGETAYERFWLDAKTTLPAPLQNRVLQIAVALVYHWALLTFVCGMFFGGTADPQTGRP